MWIKRTTTRVGRRMTPPPKRGITPLTDEEMRIVIDAANSIEDNGKRHAFIENIHARLRFGCDVTVAIKYALQRYGDSR